MNFFYKLIKIKKISYFFLILSFIFGSIFSINYFKNLPSKEKLKVLTYSSFAGLYGPGRELQKKFEKKCNCSIEWFIVEDSTSLLQRLAMVPSIDVVIGLDQISLQESHKIKWKNLSFLKTELSLGIKARGPYSGVKKWSHHFFMPLDWSPIGFIFKKSSSVQLTRLKDLPQIQWQMSFPEPESSTLGLQFYYWIYTSFSHNEKKIAQFLKEIKNKIYGPIFSWSQSYGHFQKGRVDMSLSYLTSLLYHREEQDSSYSFLLFEEGHPYQVEFMAIPLTCEECLLGENFVRFLLTPLAQKIIQKKNYMFSVLESQASSDLVDFQKIKFISYKGLKKFIKNKKGLLNLWKKHLY